MFDKHAKQREKFLYILESNSDDNSHLLTYI